MVQVKFCPPIVKAWIEDAVQDPEAFWGRAAGELPWFRTWDKVFESTPPTFRWFIGGRTNLGYNAVDHHVATGNGGRSAMIYFTESGQTVTLTYAQLLHQVKRVCAALRGLGIQKGDRITVSMPTCPEAVILMLACVRIGAIHSVVFGGFGAQALADRISASGSKLVFTADVTYRRGAQVTLRPFVNDALKTGNCTSVEKVVVLQRSPLTGVMKYGRDITWEDFLAAGEGQSTEWESMESNEPAFILATSGTTAKPKLVVHTHGGYQVHVHAMGKWCFGLKPSDVWFATSDIGWIVGHSYMVYGPLLTGCTTVVFEGALDFPVPEGNWRRAVEEFGVTGIFTSPTAVRALMKYGDEPLSSVDHSRVERIVSAGEVLNAPAWDWLQNTVLKGRVPVIDQMWQTETSGPAFGNPYGISAMPIKPGSATIALPGVQAAVVNRDGSPCGVRESGIMVFTHPFPGLTASLWGEIERYGEDYWNKIPGVYYSGDAAYYDEDGYIWFGGRADEVIKIAAHRISTIEVESAVLQHAAVAECGAIGLPDETRGEVIAAFVVLKNGQMPTDQLRLALIEKVKTELGAIAVVGEMNFVSMLPKTRSGKIMRRVLKAVVLEKSPGDITTIEDEGSVEEAQKAWQQMQQDLSEAAGPYMGRVRQDPNIKPVGI